MAKKLRAALGRPHSKKSKRPAATLFHRPLVLDSVSLVLSAVQLDVSDIDDT